ncbi:DUF771 domain-containing protein [Staphylococcus equorum]|uniref:DUF771 domain-containing protein n=1 Tax=Staphylococcus equorum TaxID=246432 RepID=UPI002980D272|nr:DUF771 domain-containing protein [Staphylococcus equorum]MDW5472020.1 DUF771 domain-containing protein [Staphylococcus equorum]
MKKSININFELPDDYLIITKDEYDYLLGKNKITNKTWWNMEDLMYETNESRNWLMNNLIKNEVIWPEIEPFTYLPKHNNDEYRFISREMQTYLIENFKRLKED